MEKDNYEIRYLPSFVKQFVSILNYMVHTLKNRDAADKFYKNVIEQIEKRSQKPEGYEKYISRGNVTYYRIYVKNYTIFYIVKNNVMEVRRILYSKRDLKKII